MNMKADYFYGRNMHFKDKITYCEYHSGKSLNSRHN